MVAEKKESEGTADETQGTGGASGEGKSRRLKVSRMNLEQVQAALESVHKHMGDYQSRYARSLLARKEALTRGN